MSLAVLTVGCAVHQSAIADSVGYLQLLPMPSVSSALQPAKQVDSLLKIPHFCNSMFEFQAASLAANQ
jgi:hypothetical protein